jgi:peptidoglycan/LPS O-acetylase OafA/YrhL
MDYFSFWPVLPALAGLLALVSLQPFKLADSMPGISPHRTSTIDGLRGFLAFGVFFGHASLYRAFLLNGTWAPAPNPLFSLVPEGAVAIFFMITGYLFWGKLLAADGWPNWITLYIGRLFRIGPIYLAAVAVMLIIIAVRSEFVLHVSPRALGAELLKWIQLGVPISLPDVNGYDRTRLLFNGVLWTLAYEWRFYASLIILSPIAMFKRLRFYIVPAATALCFAYLLTKRTPFLPYVCVGLFLSGMTVATLESAKLLMSGTPSLKSTGVLLVLGICAMCFSHAYSAAPALLLAVAFYLIVSGADLFGVLGLRGAHRLGNVSFGIYLLQGLVMTLIYRIGPVRRIALGSPLGHWAIVYGCAIALLVTAVIAHAFIEQPGLSAGRYVSKGLAALWNNRETGAVGRIFRWS